ncbi:MAG: ABC transporter permease, partial [Deferrisomatales bacterium]
MGSGEYELRAAIEAEPDRGATPFALGPRLLVARDSLDQTGLLAPGSLVHHGYRVRLAGAGTAAADARAAAEALRRAFPDAGWRVQTFDQAAPRVRRFLSRLETHLTLVGLVSLLVGGLGVGGAVRGYLAGRLSHLAVMKCLGAPTPTVVAAYLIQVLTLALAGTAAGVAAGAAAPPLLGWALGPTLPFPIRPGLYPGPLLTAGAAGLLVALAFSLRSLGAAARVSPAVLFRGAVGLAALRPPGWASAAAAAAGGALVGLAVLTRGDRGLAGGFSAGAALCLLHFRALAAGVVAAARRAPRPRWTSLRLGLAATARPGSLAGSAVFSVGLGLTALVAVVQVQGSLDREVRDALPRQAPAYFFLDIQAGQAEAFDRAVASVAGVGRVDRVPTLRGRITHLAGVAADE